MNKEKSGSRKLFVRRETLRELNPTDIAFAKGGNYTGDIKSDGSNCCCQPTSNQTNCGRPAI